MKNKLFLLGFVGKQDNFYKMTLIQKDVRGCKLWQIVLEKGTRLAVFCITSLIGEYWLFRSHKKCHTCFCRLSGDLWDVSFKQRFWDSEGAGDETELNPFSNGFLHPLVIRQVQRAHLGIWTHLDSPWTCWLKKTKLKKVNERAHKCDLDHDWEIFEEFGQRDWRRGQKKHEVFFSAMH